MTPSLTLLPSSFKLLVLIPTWEVTEAKVTPLSDNSSDILRSLPCLPAVISSAT